ncbi:hypothetical protein A2U01_0072001, partial [Trifolium medium]|nr:hypothetical protein [Trifolium medium]
VVYSLWISEEKGFEPVLIHGGRDEEQELSWVESSNFPAEAREDVGVVSGGSVEEGEEEDKVDFQPCQQLEQEVRQVGDGEVTVLKE